jgi:hypothetical protein
MSFIHFDKSIVTFHFKEILEDGSLGNPLALLGLGALVLGPKLLSTRPGSLQRSGSPNRPHMGLAAWVAMQAEQTNRSHGTDAQASGPALHLVSDHDDSVAA